MLNSPPPDLRGHQESAATLGKSHSRSFDKAVVLFYVADWLPPDFGAVGQYAVNHAREIAQLGRCVVLIGLTSGAGDSRREPCGGGELEMKRLSAERYNKTGLFSRLIWSFRANLRLMWEVCRDPRSRGAEILFTGAPPFMLFFAIPAKWLRGARVTYRITDFYPEVLLAALGKRPLPLALLERITWFLRRSVDAFEVLGEDQRRLLLAGGIAPQRITLKRDVSPIPISGRETPAPRPAALAGRKVLLYSGNYGVPHEVDTVVEGLIRHHRDGSGQFGLWLNAVGSNLGSIMRRLDAARVPYARTEPVPLGELPALLAAADAHLVTLRTRFAGLALPSKIYGCLSSGRPILFVGPTSSDVHLLCTQAKHVVYEHVEPGDVAAFAAALERLAKPGS
jgi:glycosyltransferase involved in cell wall biosynthesis